MSNQEFHDPVMVDEVLKYLHIKNNSKVIDATLGLGGHTIEFLKKGARVLGIDEDLESLEIAENKIKLACPGEYTTVPTPIKLIHGNFREIDVIAKQNDFSDVDGILADLGVSTYQLTSGTRGMSFQNPSAFLDMRMDTLSDKVTASNLLNLLRRDQLKDLFMVTMPYGMADRLSRSIEDFKETGKKFEFVSDLLDLIPVNKKSKINQSTLPFLALRMATNSEIPNLLEFLPKAFSLLKPGGSLVVISFHSGEDKVVKNFFRDMAGSSKGKILTQLPVVPEIEEINKNNRSRSAKLRAITKH